MNLRAELEKQRVHLLHELEKVEALLKEIKPRKKYTVSPAALAARQKGLNKIKAKRNAKKIVSDAFIHAATN